MNQPINQPINQLINQSVNQPISQSFNQSFIHESPKRWAARSKYDRASKVTYV